jgi:hypothetical protein
MATTKWSPKFTYFERYDWNFWAPFMYFLKESNPPVDIFSCIDFFFNPVDPNEKRMVLL